MRSAPTWLGKPRAGNSARFFNRHKAVRDFKKRARLSVEQRLSALECVEHCLEQRGPDTVGTVYIPIDALVRCYEPLHDLAAGYEKDPEKLKEQLEMVGG